MLEFLMAHLKHAVSNILDTLDPSTANAFNRKFVHPARAQQSQSLQLSDLNTFWRIELAKLEQDTIEAREALVDNISSPEWLALFKDYVAPVIVQHWHPEETGVKHNE